MYTNFRYTPTKFNEFASLKLIACATITGRSRFMTRGDGWRDQNEVFPGAHCHVANDLLEYVVFDATQIIPCYVIHLDLGRDAEKYITTLSQNLTAYINDYRERWRKERHARERLARTVLALGDKVRQKQALFAKAQKYFQYGYGAASGSKFVVQDVADVSEDEEEYGTYQKERLDGTVETDIWALDGYTTLGLDGEGEIGGGDDGEEVGDEYEDGDEAAGEQKVEWEFGMGPGGRTRFDEFYEARKAKNKKGARMPKRNDR